MKKKTVVFVSGIAGHAMQEHDLHGMFSYAPGESAELSSDLADAWEAAGVVEVVATSDEADSDECDKGKRKRKK